MKPFLLVASSIIIVAVLISAVASVSSKSDMPEKHLEVVLRDIGHKLLLSANDSLSRVLPVKKLNANTYQLCFQSNFHFISDTLINIVDREFQSNGLTKDYIVSLKSCEQAQTVLAFERNHEAGNLTPCRGRTLPVGCYLIQVNFATANTFNYHLLWLLVIPCTAGYYVRSKFRRKQQTQTTPGSDQGIPLGNYRFDAQNNALKIGDKSIPLSEKETKALTIFAENINQVVDRDKLLKEIWEDSGIVVISRNVDVLVSKLRKKLSDEPSLKFINVHGRGYKFVIG